MAIETSLEQLTKAVEANTAIQQQVLATITKGSTPDKPAPDKPAAEAKAAAKPKAEPKAAAKPKAEPKAAAKPKKIEVRESVDLEEIRAVVRKVVANDGGDADERERRKGLLSSAFDHLGVAKISDLDDEQRVKLAHYFDHWEADATQALDFEALDEAVSEAASAGGGDEDDDMMG